MVASRLWGSRGCQHYGQITRKWFTSTSRSPGHLRFYISWSFCHLLLTAAHFNVTFTVQHIPCIDNNIADDLSQFHWQKLRQLAPDAQLHPVQAVGTLDPYALEAHCCDFKGWLHQQAAHKCQARKSFTSVQLGKFNQSGSPRPTQLTTWLFFCDLSGQYCSAFNHQSLSVGRFLLVYQTGLSWSSRWLLGFATGA